MTRTLALGCEEKVSSRIKLSRCLMPRVAGLGSPDGGLICRRLLFAFLSENPGVGKECFHFSVLVRLCCESRMTWECSDAWSGALRAGNTYPAGETKEALGIVAGALEEGGKAGGDGAQRGRLTVAPAGAE